MAHNRSIQPHNDDEDSFDDRALNNFIMALIVGIGSWLGGRTGQAIWEKGKDLFTKDDTPDK
jgi:hypothetical protein